MGPQSKEVKNSKRKHKSSNTTQAKHSEIPLYVALLLLEFKDDL
jgi:hypothetical protein